MALIPALGDFSFTEVGAVVLILFIIGLGIWIFLYLNHYSDWFKLKSKKKEAERKKLRNYARDLLIRIDHLISNYEAYPENTMLAEAEFFLKAFLVKAYDLDNENLNIIKAYKYLEKKDKEESLETLKELKDVIDSYNLIKFSRKKVTKNEIINLLQQIKEFINEKTKEKEKKSLSK